jgi:pSer/pThr/pTyr-binding forkhead associated (FHA) protein
MAKLIVNPTSSSRREIVLPRSLLTIGRDPSNDVVLPDAMVSRRHAVIEFRGSQFYVRDCNSSNGSLVNGDRVSERNLRDGDLLAIGTARLLFREEGEQEDAGAKVVQHPSAPRMHCPACDAAQRRPLLQAVRRRPGGQRATAQRVQLVRHRRAVAGALLQRLRQPALRRAAIRPRPRARADTARLSSVAGSGAVAVRRA